MALSTGVEDMFAHESWEPPDPELRKLRKDFYGPLTAELLRHSMAGALAEEEAKTARQAASKARAKGRWTAANSKVKGIGKALHEMQELTLERWFITWQEKNVVSVVPPSASTGDGHSSGGEEKAVAEDLDVLLLIRRRPFFSRPKRLCHLPSMIQLRCWLARGRQQT